MNKCLGTECVQDQISRSLKFNYQNSKATIYNTHLLSDSDDDNREPVFRNQMAKRQEPSKKLGLQRLKFVPKDSGDP